MFDHAVELWRTRFDVDVANAFVLDMLVELRLEFVAAVSGQKKIVAKLSAGLVAVPHHPLREGDFDAGLLKRLLLDRLFVPVLAHAVETNLVAHDLYLIIDLEPDRQTGGRVINWSFHELPARPMVDLELDPSVGIGATDWLRAKLESINPEAIVRIRVNRTPDETMCEAIKAASLRQLALPTQTVEVSWPRKLGRKS